MARIRTIDELNQYGCPGESRVLAHNHVYLVSESGGDYFKVGVSIQPSNRFMDLRQGNPRRLIVRGVWCVETRKCAMAIEQEVLDWCPGQLPGREWCRGDWGDVSELIDQLAMEAAGADI